MLATILFAAFLIIRAAPESFLGRAFRHGLVDWPARKLARFTRGQAVTLLVLSLMVWGAFAFLDRELFMVMSRGLPEAYIWASTFEISTLADVLAAAALVSAQSNILGMARRVRAFLGRSVRRLAPRARRPRSRPGQPRKPDNDDDLVPALAWAA